MDDVEKKSATKILTERKSPALAVDDFDAHASTSRNHDVAHEWVNVSLNDNIAMIVFTGQMQSITINMN